MAKQKFKTTRALFFGRGIWVCLLVVCGFIAMVMADVDRDLVHIAAPFAIVALGCSLLWLSRVGYWWMHSWGDAPEG